MKSSSSAEIVDYYAITLKNFLPIKKLELRGQEPNPTRTNRSGFIGVIAMELPVLSSGSIHAPTFMAGNTTFGRHASIVPQCAERHANLLQKSGLPEGFLQNLLIPHDSWATLIATKPYVWCVINRQRKAGSSVASLAGKNLKPSVLELGGNDAVYFVLEDSDFGLRVRTGHQRRWGKYRTIMCSPQANDCLSTVAEQFINGLKVGWNPFEVGGSMDPKPM